jgi:alkylation response protein AidB-like acyl-CoA dehydrogenase
MRFAFDEQQLEFRSQLRGFLESECTPADVRAAFDGACAGSGPPGRTRWEQLAAMGVVGLAVPESEGGLGLGAVDLVGLLEEAGRAGLPEPLAETAALVVPLLVEVAAGGPSDRAQGGLSDVTSDGRQGALSDGTQADQSDSTPGDTAREWLRRIAAGEAIAAVVPEAESPAVWAAEADLVVAFEPGRVVLVPAAEVDTTRVDSIDSTRLLAAVTVRKGSGSGSGSGQIQGPQADRHLVRLRNRGAFAAAAVLLGAADRLMSMTREYALERQQFGRPIGSFQAVKHHLASAYVKLEMARPLTYKAAWSLDDDPDCAALDCSLAKATASEAALEVARAALQVHGAMGYTWEHDIHMWMKRIWVLASSWGDSAQHFAAALDSLAGSGM